MPIPISISPKHVLPCFQFALLTVSTVAALAASPDTRSAASPSLSQAKLAQTYGKLPLSFEANHGQTDPSVKYLSRGNGYSLFLTDSAAVLSLSKSKSGNADVVRMQLSGADPHAKAAGAEQLPGISNYFIGNDPAKWHSNIPSFAKVRYTSVYPGVDLVYYGNQSQLEYDFVVAPHADPKPIRLQFAGATKLALTPSGDLTIRAEGGEIAFHKPEIYQQMGEKRTQIAGRFKLLTGNTVEFSLGSYDHAQALVIDPILVYSTYLGGSRDDHAVGVAVDAAGSAYVVGGTSSTDFPVTPGAFNTAGSASGLIFITKFNPAGTALVYSTFLGYPGEESAAAIALDSSGNAYIVGSASGSDFPASGNAVQTANNGTANGVTNAFAAKLNATGSSLLYFTYLGGTGGQYGTYYGPSGIVTTGDYATAVAVDASGDAYVAGSATSANFPLTSGTVQQQNNAAPNQGSNGFVAELNPTATALLYSTYLGGSGDPDDPGDFISSIALDSNDDAYVTGTTLGGFPTTSGAFQEEDMSSTFINEGSLFTDIGPTAFVTKLNPTGAKLLYSSYLGGSGNQLTTQTGSPPYPGDQGYGIAVDNFGDAYVTGSTGSLNFPVTAQAFQPVTTCLVLNSTCADIFISKVNPTGSSLVYSTYINQGQEFGNYFQGAAAGNAIAVDGTGDAFIVSGSAVIKLNAAGSALQYSGSLNSSTETGGGVAANAIQLDAADNAYVTGYVEGSALELSENPYQGTNKSGSETAFLTKLALNATTTSTPNYGTQIALTASTGQTIAGLPVNFNIQVSNNAGTPIPSGPVVLSAQGGPDVTLELNSSGQAAFVEKTLAPGNYTVEANYPGNAYFESASTNTEGGPYALFNENLFLTILPPAPAFGLAAGIYAVPQQVKLTDSYPGATIQYSTNNGSTWTAYSGPISVSSTTTIMAEAVFTSAAGGTVTSSTASETFTIHPPTATPTFSLPAGTYNSDQTVEISDVTSNASIYYTANGETPTTNSTKYTAGSTIQINETTNLQAIAIATGDSTSAVASAEYTIHLTLDTPVLSLKSGIYSASQTVTITDASPSAKLFYTTSGGTPTASSTPYTGPITVSKSETLKVVALATGYPSSTVVSATYTIQ